ncbi:MAG: M56 family metallopeptidase [Clostridia bacterium]|nr:M56 family metallopeptidase [Clostridia bacterium]
MAELFLSIVNMSISACWLVLAVLLLRLVLKKAPKWIICLLWGFAGLRLVMPFLLESIFSLIPSAETVSPEIMTATSPSVNTGIPALNNTINPVISESFAPEIGASANPLQILVPIAAAVWLVGIAVLLIYTLVSFLRLKKKIGTAVLLRDNIYQSENVASPFVLGIINPKIYLPFNMSEQDTLLVIAHENAHIKRKDHLWKPLGFLILTLHWFNPLVWLGYVLLCRDIELACDERVVKGLDNVHRADYSQALLTCSINRRMIAACPLAFGEVSVKDRVKSVLSYKKPAFWIIVVAVVASVAVAVCFLTNPKKDKEYYDSGYSLQIVDETYIGTTQLPEKTDTYYFDVLNGTKGKLSNGARFKITECNLQQGKLTVKLSGAALYSTTEAEPVALKEIVVEEGSDGVVLTDKQYTHYYTFSFVRTQSLDEAVAQAIFELDKPAHSDFGTELVSEGHEIYGTEIDGNQYTVYAAISYNLWGFENEYFVPKYDFFETVIMTFKKTAGEYELLNIDYPIGVTDSDYESSAKELFPKKYWNRVLNPTVQDYKNHQGQNVSYAQIYLIETGRNPETIRYYNQLESVTQTMWV